MLKNVNKTNIYRSLNLMKDIHHAYLFYSIDKELNNNIALTFAQNLLCKNKTICNECAACKQFINNSHPDLFIIDQASVKVEDVNKIIDKLSTKPIAGDVKLFVILNAENINEISQNKLLKSLEEPNPSNVFILTSSKTDKLLATVLSRLHKISIPKLSNEDLEVLSLDENPTNLTSYAGSNLTLTDILNLEKNEAYAQTLNAIKYIFENLKSSQDIPKVANSIPTFDKNLFLPLLEKVFISCLNNNLMLDKSLSSLISSVFSKKALIKCLPLIADAHKKQMSNVNFSYILDNLLFNILKEKFLCKQ